MYGETGPTGEFGEYCWDGENRASAVHSIWTGTVMPDLQTLFVILK